MISKDFRKTIVLSFMFLFNSFEVCHPLCKESKNIFTTEPMKLKINIHIRCAFLLHVSNVLFQACAEACVCDRTPHILKPGIVFSIKANLYSMAWRCSHLHLIKQNCFLKTILITLVLMTQAWTQAWFTCFPFQN